MLTGSSQAQAPGGPVTPYVDPARAFLFAHMTKERYGELYYSVSLDGLHWTRLNGGRPVSPDFTDTPPSRKVATAGITSSGTRATTIR